MKDTHLKIFQEYSHELIGIPYELLDCYGIVSRFYKIVFNVDLPKCFYSDPFDTINMNKVINNEKHKYTKTSKPMFGDIVVMHIHGMPAHVGIYLDEDLILHTHEKSGSIIDRSFKWENKIEGYYRYGQNKA